MGFHERAELEAMGFAHVGVGVRLSRRASVHGAARIRIGDFTRIDDFCVLSAGEGGIEIGHHSHLAVMCSLIGSAPIRIGHYCGVSGKASIYSSSDDFSGECMTNPTLPARYTRVQSAPVVLADHCVIGAGSVVMPGVEFGEAAILGALSLAKGRLEPFGIYGGTPARWLRARSRHLLELQRSFEQEGDAAP